MNVNKIGFNNFKAFGEKMQTFTKKPITLVYGPNSIGKSSFLHSQLYLEYLRNVGINIDLMKTNFAGDSLDLNGFGNFIHKHEINRELKYEYHLQDVNTITELLSNNFLKIKELDDKGFFNIKTNVALLENKLGTYDEKSISTFKSKIAYSNIKQKLSALNEVDKNVESQDMKIMKENFEKTSNIIITSAYIAYKKSKNIDWQYQNDSKEDFQKYKVLFENEITKLENTKDILEKAIIFTQLNNPEEIYDQLEFFQYLSNISIIKLSIRLSMDEKGVQPSLDYYIDNEKLFSMNENIFDINDNHPLINYLKKKEAKYLKKIREQSEKQKDSTLEYYDNEVMDPLKKIFGYAMVSQFFTNFLDIFSDFLYAKTSVSSIDILKLRVLSFLNNVDNQKTVQYFSPLRFYPERWDLNEKVKAKTDNRQSVNDQQYLTMGMLKNMNSIFYKKPFLYLNINFWRTILRSQFFYDGINNLLPESMKLTPVGASTAQKFWSKLIHSQSLQNKLNSWFLDESKLKSTYKVYTREYEVEYSFVVNLFRKVFAIKPVVEKELYFLDLRSNTEVSPRDMGLGISQMLPILLASLDSEEIKIFIEQPELHLHPAVQAELADEFIRSYKENDNEFMIETHSEHLLLRIMKRMRHTAEGRIDKDDVLALTPDDVCLLYVDSDAENTFLNELELDTDGTLLDPWPNGFFEEGHRERFD